MQYFEWNGQQATWRNHGETVVVEPWGPDSLRVRAVLMGEVRDDRFALLDPMPGGDVEFVQTDEEHALLRNGKITAKMDVCGWKHRVRLTFVNQKGEVLLQETDGENALVLPPALGLLGIQAAQPVADALSFLFSLAVVSGVLRQLKKTPDRDAPPAA